MVLDQDSARGLNFKKLAPLTAWGISMCSEEGLYLSSFLKQVLQWSLSLVDSK